MIKNEKRKSLLLEHGLAECYCCKEIKKITEFYFLSSINRLDTICKKCNIEKAKLRYKNKTNLKLRKLWMKK